MAYRVLEVTLQSAKDLKRVNLITRMEVYAVVTISGDPVTRQCTQPDPYGGRHPCWNATFRFNVPPHAAAASGCLHVLLRTERALGDRDVGEVIVPLADILAGAGAAADDPRPRPPQCASYQVRKVHRFEPRGTLNVSYRLGPVVAPQEAPPPPAAAKADVQGPVVAFPVAPPPFYAPPYGAYLPPTLALPPPPPPAQAAGRDGVHQPAPSAGPNNAYNVPAYSQPAGHGAGHHPAAQSAGTNSNAYGVPAYPQPAGHGAAHHPVAQPAGTNNSAYGVPSYPPAAGHGAAHRPSPPSSGYDAASYPQAAGGYAAASPAKGKSVDSNLEFGVSLGAGLVGGAIGGMLASDAVAYSYGYRAGLADGGVATYKNSYHVVPTKVQDKVESNWKMV